MMALIDTAWGNLDSVKFIESSIHLGTLAFWTLLVIFEVRIHFWEKRSGIFKVLALISFAIAVLGEVAQYKFDARKEQLYEEQEFNLKKELADFKLKNVPRTLTDAQKVALIENLKGLLRGEILVYSQPDAESQTYAAQIFDTLQTSGWSIALSKTLLWMHPHAGIFLVVRDKGQLKNPDVIKFYGAFKNAGLEILPAIEDIPSGTFQLWVGPRQ